MSNIKKKDRKESDLQVALDGEDLVTSIMSMVNDEAKISKRQRLLIGKRIFDNSFESIENLRAANMIRSSSKKNFNKRISLGLDAQIYANKLNTDLRLLKSSIIASNPKVYNKNKLPDWYDNIVDKSINYEKNIDKWIKGEYDRNRRYLETIRKENNKEEEERSSSNNLFEKKSIPLPKVDVNDKNYIPNKNN